MAPTKRANAHAHADAVTPPAKSRAKRAKETAGDEVSASGEAEALRAYIARFRTSDEALVPALRAAVTGEGDDAACAQLKRMFDAEGVARCFVGLGRDNTLQLLPLVAHLRARWPELEMLRGDGHEAETEGAAAVKEVEAVDLFVAVIQAQFGRRNISAASKVLVALGACVPIYDSLARASLGLGSGASASSYAKFHAAWHARFGTRRYGAAWRELQREGVCPVTALLSERWFQYRGFDNELCAAQNAAWAK
jgi:hypothetical protein